MLTTREVNYDDENGDQNLVSEKSELITLMLIISVLISIIVSLNYTLLNPTETLAPQKKIFSYSPPDNSGKPLSIFELNS